MSAETAIADLNKQEIATLARDLDRAADWLDLHGWTQGIWVDGKGRCCARGAIWESTRAHIKDRKRRNRRIELADEALLAEIRATTGSPTVIRWNDKKGQSKRVVTAAFRRTARKLRGAKR